MMNECDTLLMVGIELSRTPSSCPKEGRRAACRSTSTAGCSSLRYPMDVNLVGDSARDAARAAAAAATRKTDRSWRDRIEKNVADWWEVLEARAMNERRTRSTRSACSGSSRRACRTTASSRAIRASSASWYARDLKIRRGMMASLSGTLATMGPGVPYAIAAKFAHPDRVGDRAGRATARCR